MSWFWDLSIKKIIPMSAIFSNESKFIELQDKYQYQIEKVKILKKN